jgi:hypothetical protein
MKVWRDGAGWHTTSAPSADFLTKAEAERASALPAAEAYSLEISLRTLAKGERLLEWTCECKARRNLPYTEAERAYMDRLIEARIRQRDERRERLSPPESSRSALDWMWDKSGGIASIGGLGKIRK